MLTTKSKRSLPRFLVCRLSLNLCLLLGLFLLIQHSVHARGTEEQLWHSNQDQSVKGELVDVAGPLILIKHESVIRFVSLTTLTEEELERVVAFQERQEGTKRDWAASKNKVSKHVLGNLNSVKNGRFVPYETAQHKEPRYYLIYFSAGWCGPCHRFTPELIRAYADLKQKAGDDLELIFVSHDESWGDQLAYASKFNMPWPILEFNRCQGPSIINQWQGDGIPCLILLTNQGDLIFHTYKNNEYMGPDSVLEDLNKLLPLITQSKDEPNEGQHRLAVVAHQQKHKADDAPLAPYLIGLRKGRYKGMKVAETKVTLKVGADGKVGSVQFAEDMPTGLQNLLREDIERWLFLPRILKGKPVDTRVQIPVDLGGS